MSAASGSTQTSGGRTEPAIVVGVDGSPTSVAALRWAADYGALTGGHLLAVAAWQWPVSMVVALPIPEEYNPMEETRARLERTVADVLGLSPAIVVSVAVECGAPASVLLKKAAGADLLVVGSRGHGGFTGLLLGSTSEHCVRHAPCPVVVIRQTGSRLVPGHEQAAVPAATSTASSTALAP